MKLSSTADPLLLAALTRAYSALKDHKPDSKEYGAIMDQIVKLHKMKETEEPTPSPVSLDTLILVGANLLGIVMVLKHEKANIITTKAWMNILKPR